LVLPDRILPKVVSYARNLNVRCVALAIGRLQALITSTDGLWVDIGKLARTEDYILAQDDFCGRVLMELAVVEGQLGTSRGTEEISVTAH
jgi:hypothetical protein